jgi:hypothetical protein
MLNLLSGSLPSLRRPIQRDHNPAFSFRPVLTNRRIAMRSLGDSALIVTGPAQARVVCALRRWPASARRLSGLTRTRESEAYWRCDSAVNRERTEDLSTFLRPFVAIDTALRFLDALPVRLSQIRRFGTWPCSERLVNAAKILEKNTIQGYGSRSQTSC